jgi:hypothetical protein
MAVLNWDILFMFPNWGWFKFQLTLIQDARHDLVLGDPFGLGEIFGISFGLHLLGGKNCLCLEIGEFWADLVRGTEGDGAFFT